MKTTQMITMKSLYILTALLGFQFNTLFAATGFSESTLLSNAIMTSIATPILAPVTPAEATFEDVSEAGATAIDIVALIPMIPMTADFSDGAPEAGIQINLAPVTPKEADFEEEKENGNTTGTGGLAPVTPNDADFEDHV